MPWRRRVRAATLHVQGLQAAAPAGGLSVLAAWRSKPPRQSFAVALQATGPPGSSTNYREQFGPDAKVLPEFYPPTDLRSDAATWELDTTSKCAPAVRMQPPGAQCINRHHLTLLQVALAGCAAGGLESRHARQLPTGVPGRRPHAAAGSAPRWQRAGCAASPFRPAPAAPGPVCCRCWPGFADARPAAARAAAGGVPTVCLAAAGGGRHYVS